MKKEEIIYWIKIFEKYHQGFRSKDGKEISFCEVLKTLEQLQNNWNELNKYIDNRFKAIEFDYDEKIIDKFEFVVRENELLKLKVVLKRMQELEGKSE